MCRLLIITIFIICLAVPASSQGGFPHFKVSHDIELIRLSEHAYVHVSYSSLPQIGRFPSNGLIFINGSKAFLFDTPVTDLLTKDLVIWLKDSLKLKIVGFIPNHWHADCMGGLNYIKSIGIPSYANEKTIAIAKSKNLPIPQHGFSDSLILHLGNKIIVCNYYGSAHTTDNIVTWIPSERILFGGCMVKDLKSETLGNITDADLHEWPKTIARVIAAYPSADIVIPGHEPFGGPELLNHTLDLLMKTK